MDQVYQTEQEHFWAGHFGDHYIERNRNEQEIAQNTIFFAKILEKTWRVSSVFEFGANTGLNLMALKHLLPNVELAALEINHKAVEILRRHSWLKVYQGSMLDFRPREQFDLAFVKGVLIHIAPDRLNMAYDCLYQTSRRYILIAEYYNPTPVEIPYRGHQNRLFKRDFAGEMLDRYNGLQLVDYGFTYHRAPYPQDDLNWFLLQK